MIPILSAKQLKSILSMWQDIINKILLLPRSQQRLALKRLQEKYVAEHPEEWNTEFGSDSLYDAWSTIPFMQSLYTSNRKIIRDILVSKTKWDIVEIGGGSGTLWQNFFSPQDVGSFTLIDPVASSHDAVASNLPSNINFRSIIENVEEVEVPEADVLVCSLTLHHVAGLDTEQRQKFGLEGLGKFEILRKFVKSVQLRNGICILNEADIYAELDLPSNSSVLVDQLIEGYVRRAGMGVVEAITQSNINPSLKRKLEAILLHWCINQVELVSNSHQIKRDVYELNTPRWINILERAGADLISHEYTDNWCLFHQYVFSCAK